MRESAALTPKLFPSLAKVTRALIYLSAYPDFRLGISMATPGEERIPHVRRQVFK